MIRNQFSGASKFIAVAMTGVVVFSASAIGSQNAMATPASVSTGHGAMTFEFPDVVFDASENCITPSFNVDVKSSIPNSDWFVDITIRKNGQSPTGSEGRSYGTNSGPGTGTIQICPGLDGSGTFIVDGVFTTFDNQTNNKLEKTFTSSVNIKKGSSVFVLSSLKRSGSNISVTGNVTGKSEKYGMVGLRGYVRVDYQLKNSTKWLALTNVFTDKSGNFKMSVAKNLPKKILFRVKFMGNDSMEASEVQKVA